MKNEITNRTTYTPAPGDLVLAFHRGLVRSTTPVLGLRRGRYNWNVEVPPNTPMLVVDLVGSGPTVLVLHKGELIEVLLSDVVPANGKSQ